MRGEPGRACLHYAIRHMCDQGHESLHVMVHEGTSLEPFTQVGFFFYEQEHDVYLYTGRCADLEACSPATCPPNP